MAKHLVVVESPAKAKTIEKYLGRDYKVMASYGHVRDLIPKKGAVDPEQEFLMRYEPIERNVGHIEAIAKELKQCDSLFLATDPDREGEAIAWHLRALLQEKKALKDIPMARIVFHQITKQAVKEAIAKPRDISMDLVNAQQARRALDYLVGFELSPLLWRKIRPGLSAGRVQSPALRMIVEREIDIENFKSEEYWTIEADVSPDAQPFTAKLTHYCGEKLTQFSFQNGDQSQSAVESVQKAAQGFLTVNAVTQKERKRHPSPPFITSTLQQEAARKLGFSTQRTMQVAQQLYEGLNVGEETVGLITYMRTDSVTLATEAIDEIRSWVTGEYGKNRVPDEPRVYKTKSKNAQEAHEAVRPTSIARTPDQMKPFLNAEQWKLYQLIWRRTVASQMIDATVHTVSIDLGVDDHTFRASGSTIVHPGFITVYEEGQDDVSKDGKEKESVLPPLQQGDRVSVSIIRGVQHFTEPPPRYTEASLVKALEEHDIGRPSTYASIIATLKNRKYVELDNKRFKATDVGRIVNQFLTRYFTQYVDYDFTAHLENDLDAVSRGDRTWVPLLKEFWDPFKTKVEEIAESVKRSDVTQEAIEENCPECGKQLAIRLGKNGRFIGCTGFPECSYTRNLNGDQNEDADLQASIEERTCPECQSALVLRYGRFGKFIGCSNYPNCKHIESLEKPKDTGVECPVCKEGHIVARKSRRGKPFYACDRYPKCKYALWNEPIAEPCPKCQWPIVTIKITKRSGTEKVCPKEGCDFKEAVEETE